MSSLEEFDIGDTPTITGNFSVSGVSTDPTTVTLSVTDPLGVTTTYTGAQIAKTSTGNYTKDIPVNTAGEWVAVWSGTGSVSASGSVRFAVRR